MRRAREGGDRSARGTGEIAYGLCAHDAAAPAAAAAAAAGLSVCMSSFAPPNRLCACPCRASERPPGRDGGPKIAGGSTARVRRSLAPRCWAVLVGLRGYDHDVVAAQRRQDRLGWAAVGRTPAERGGGGASEVGRRTMARGNGKCGAQNGMCGWMGANRVH
ncbi:hypothetical protein BD413DRAFT_83079 [Trametes elegans]|nr:hypothetical protein BD413DRAFT_83079 [Trametes elegans]